MQHCPVVLYHICSNQGLRVENGPAQGGQGLEAQKYMEIYLNRFIFRTSWLRCLIFVHVKQHCLLVLQQMYSMMVSGSKTVVSRGPGFEGIIYLKIFFFRSAWLSCLIFGMLLCLVVLNLVAPVSKMGSPGFEPQKNMEKY